MNKRGCTSVMAGVVISLILALVPATCLGAGLTYSFDDGDLSTYTRALPILESYGKVGTINVVYCWVGRSGRVSFDQMKDMESRGWEVCSHSLTHPRFDHIPQSKSDEPLQGWTPTPQKNYTYQAQYNYQSMPFILADNKILRNVGTIEEVETTPGSAFFDSSSSTVYIRTPNDLSPENYDIRADSVETELEQSKVLLEEQGLNIQSFIVPFSMWNADRAQMSRSYYSSVGAAGTFNTIPPKNPHYLRRFQIGSHTTVDEIKSGVDTAIQNDFWLILMFHGIGYPEEGCVSLCWTPEQLAELAAYVSDSGIQVVTQQQGLDLIPEPPESPLPDLKVNGQDDSVIVSFGIPVDCTFSLDPKSYSGKNADWWLYVDTHSGIRYYFNGSSWVTNETSALQSPLYNFPHQLIRHQIINLEGTHTFYCGVDLSPNGILDDPRFLDSVRVTVQK